MLLIKKVFIFIICMLCIFGLIFYSKTIGNGISNGLKISCYIIIPSMYLFMILGNIISSSKLSYYLSLPFSFIGKYVFKLDPSLFYIFIVSLLGGYPIGCKLISDKIKSGDISTQTGSYMMNFCVNCSPSFLITSVSIMIFSTPLYGVIIYCSQIFACMIIALILGYKKPILKATPTQNKPLSVSTLFVNSVNNATQSMIIICSFIVVFCGLFVFVDLIPLDDSIKIYLKGLLEVTSGCQLINPQNIFISILQICLFTSFGGVCVVLQIMALIKGSGIKIFPFIVIRLFYTLISCVITYVSLLILNPVSDCINSYNQNLTAHLYSVSPLSSLFFLLLGIMFLSILLQNNSPKP